MKKIKTIQKEEIEVFAPPAKAHTLRAIAIASLAKGTSIIKNPLLGDDQRNLISCIKSLGIDVTLEDNLLVIKGNDGKYTPSGEPLNVGESGVSMNFLCSIACLSEKEIIITGADSLCMRPIDNVVTGLRQLGCKIDYLKRDGYPPIIVKGGGILGGKAEINGSKTSQYFSSIILASPYARSRIILHCLDEMMEKPYFDITCQMMLKFGVKVVNENYKMFRVDNDVQYRCTDIEIEGDYSSASFFMLASAICGSKVTIKNLLSDTKQGDKVFLDIIQKMGCEVSVNQKDKYVQVIGKKLYSIDKNMKDIPDLVPPLAIACAYAKGVSKLSGVGHLRYKECNRLEAIINGLKEMNIESSFSDDALFIEGSENIKSGTINPYNDHRIAMSFAIAGLPLDGQCIRNPSYVNKSFPDFWEKMNSFYIN